MIDGRLEAFERTNLAKKMPQVWLYVIQLEAVAKAADKLASMLGSPMHPVQVYYEEEFIELESSLAALHSPGKEGDA